MSSLENPIEADEIRYLLQSAAHHNIGIISEEQMDLLISVNNLCERSEHLRDNIKTILNDMSLYDVKASNNSVLESLKQCLIHNNNSPYHILYRCSDRSIVPQIIFTPENGSSSAIIFIDTIIFLGFEKEHYKYLKNELGIHNVKIIYRSDGESDTNISDTFEPLSKYLKLGHKGIQFDITEHRIFILLIMAIIIMIIITPKLSTKL